MKVKIRVTSEEYLLQERQAEYKSEYIDGKIFDMASSSLNHSYLVSNLMAGFGGHVRGKGCSVFASRMRLYIPASESYLYPDITVVCDKPELTDEHQDSITNPTLIIEVLSPSTSDFDHVGKFMRYRSIPTLQEYLMIDSQAVQTELYTRQPDGTWSFREQKELQDVLLLQSIGFELSLEQAYQGVDFSRNR